MKPENPVKALCWLIFFFTLLACSKREGLRENEEEQPRYENELPPVTTNGANTIGFMLNENVFTPKGTYNNRDNFRVNINPSNGAFRIEILRVADSILYEFRLVSDQLRGVGNYPISRETSERIYFSKHLIRADGTLEFKCLTQNFISIFYNATGFLKITRYDTARRIYSGEFEVNFSNPGCGLGEPVKITKGRFDVKDN